MTPTMTAVPNSSLIAADNYDSATQTLTVKFANGDTWSYSGVDPRTADAYETADSKGKYFLKTIKPNVAGTKVTV